MSRPPSNDNHDPAASPARADLSVVDNEQRLLTSFLDQRDKVEQRFQRWVSCRSAAADLCQELFLRLWRRRDVQVQDFNQYLHRSARNLAIDHLRSQNVRGQAEQTLTPDQLESSPTLLEDHHQAATELERIEQLLSRLPERTRHIFLLSRVHGQSYSEIASAMDLSVSSVEKHMMKALQAFKRQIEKAKAE